MNHWAFTGFVDKITPDSTKGGKKLWHVALTDSDGCLCVFDSWRPVDFAPGTPVYATGTLKGREYEGKHYAGLTCAELHAVVLDAETPTPEKKTAAPASPRPAQPEQPALPPSSVDDQIPF